MVGVRGPVVSIYDEPYDEDDEDDEPYDENPVEVAVGPDPEPTDE